MSAASGRDARAGRWRRRALVRGVRRVRRFAVAGGCRRRPSGRCRQGSAMTTARPCGEPVELEPEIGAEQMLQPRARGRHADALLQRGRARPRTGRRRRRALRAGACRLRGAAEMSTCPGPDLPRDAVLDGVLDERLQQQARHARVQRLGLDVEADDQPIGEPRLLDLRGTSRARRAPPRARPPDGRDARA